MTATDDGLQRRVADLLHHAVASLDSVDRDQRIIYCREHNEHGVRMHPSTEDDLVTFTWGGRPLCVVHRDVLVVDGPFRAEFITDTPDTVPDEWKSEQ